MKCVVVLLVALAAVVSGFQYTEEWEAWKKEHGRVYESDEIELRSHITWEGNMQFVKQHNAHADEIGFTVEMNKFADLDSGEFAKLYNGFLGHADSDDDSSLTRKPQQAALPATVDWRKKGAVTAVKNQGSCASCYAFSTTGALEGQQAIRTRSLMSLSEQKILDCSGKYENHGCQGGLINKSYKYLMSVKGIQSERTYTYKAQEQKCMYNKNLVMVPCKGYRNIKKGSEYALQEAVTNVGPIAVAIDADHIGFQLYRSGVYMEHHCSSRRLNRGTLVVGYGTERGKPYWIVKNSLGTGWGMDGYILMSRNKNNHCGIATRASYPLI